MKAMLSPDDGRILGFTMVGAEAGEVMAVVQIAMQAGLPYTELRDSILTHPTMAEGLNVLFSSIRSPKPFASHPAAAASGNGIVDRMSAHSVDETVARIRHMLDARGIALFRTDRP